MIIIYSIETILEMESSGQDYIILRPDNWGTSHLNPWDDFDYTTTCQARMILKGKTYSLPAIKILIVGEFNTHNFLKGKFGGNKFIEFPLEGVRYLSQPVDIEFYEKLKSLLAPDEIVNILEALNDASQISHTADKKLVFQDILDSGGFHKSLLRDMASRKAFEEGWLMILNRTVVKDISFDIEFKLYNYNRKHKVKINFTNSKLPNNINVIIGPNGTGKTQTLKKLVSRLIGYNSRINAETYPYFTKIVLVSYSPFESFSTLSKNRMMQTKCLYEYYGFHTDGNLFDIKKPNKDACNSVISIIKEDNEELYIYEKISKFITLKDILGKTISFDSIGLKKKTYTESNQLDAYWLINDVEEAYKIIDKIINNYNEEAGIYFFKDGIEVKLSSGQKIFSLMICCIISSIRKDTLLLIDEPELYLHPTLEISLMKMLKAILSRFSSFAVIGTHSSIIAREVPRDRISVLKDVGGFVVSSNPPFETFGGDLERISSYVFDDIDVDKPYEEWLRAKASEFDSKDDAIASMKALLNEESIIFLGSLYRGQ